MVTIPTSQRARQLPGLTLFLCEQTAHISRGLEVDCMGNLSRISRSGLRSKLRYASFKVRRA